MFEYSEFENQIVTAQQFRLTDKSGRLRAVLGLEDGEPSLSLYDAQEELRLWVGIGEDGEPGVVFYDKMGIARASLGLGEEGDPGIHLLDKDENLRAVLSLESNGEPGLDLLDRNEKDRINLGLLDGEGACVIFSDECDQSRIVLCTTENGAPGL